MKSNLAAIFLVLLCLGLAIFIWMQHLTHSVETRHLSETIVSKATLVSNLEDKLNQQVLTNLFLETNLAASQIKLSNDLAAARDDLSTTAANLKKAQDDARVAAAAVAAAAAALAEKEKKIEELEANNADLDTQSSALRESITNLNIQIAAAKKKLDASEGDKVVLMAELKQLQAQKDELERKLSDLASLKEQIRILKDNLSVAKRIEWIRSGIYDAFGKKGGERLVNPPPPVPPLTNKGLDVEIHEKGGVKINSPAATNAPATNAPAARAPAAR
jgi:chromosome segregation ATPase